MTENFCEYCDGPSPGTVFCSNDCAVLSSRGYPYTRPSALVTTLTKREHFAALIMQGFLSNAILQATCSELAEETPGQTMGKTALRRYEWLIGKCRAEIETLRAERDAVELYSEEEFAKLLGVYDEKATRPVQYLATLRKQYNLPHQDRPAHDLHPRRRGGVFGDICDSRER